MSAEDMDFCGKCEKETEWDGETCKSCGRQWGYDQ